MAFNFTRQFITKLNPISLYYPDCSTSLNNLKSIKRWRRVRKPLSKGTAPSKLFIVRGSIRLPKDQQLEKDRLVDRHKCFFESTRNYLIEMSQVGEESELAKQEQIKEEAEEHIRLMEYNRLENERMQVIREERLKKELEAELQRIKEFKENEKLRMDELYKEGLEKIKETEIMVKDFISAENLTEAIEAAMANPTDYNFAIDLDGQVYPGKTTKISMMNLKNLEKLPEHRVNTPELRPYII